MPADFKLSPAKGKSREEACWHAEWWDFYPLIERPRRPIVWTNSSTIFNAHATQPFVTGRLFSSSKQFVLPSPQPIMSSPLSYGPPDVISVSPDDDWLFAYFPGRSSDGTGCLWKRGLQVDSWTIKDYWGFVRGAGVVTAAWAGMERQWVTDDTGFATRLPPRGPTTPISSPTLLLVTENHQLNLCYFRAYMPNLKVMKCSLTQPSLVLETQPLPIHDTPNGPGGVRVCKSASIGLAYNESSILIAMRSHLYPSPSPRPPTSFNTMDLSLSLDISQQPPSEHVPSVEWESWGEEATIELCEVHLGFDGAIINLAARPLPPIHQPAGQHLTELSFICTPPQTPISDPAKSSKSSQHQKRPSDSRDHLRGQIYLAASFLNFGDYSSLPQSELILYSIARNLTALGLNKAAWLLTRKSTRTFSPGILAFFVPWVVPSSPHVVNLYAGILDSVDSIPTRKRTAREIPIGNVVVLKLPDLDENDEWEKSRIMAPADGIGPELPLNAAVSPNNVLLSTISSSLFATRTAIHTLPIRSTKDSIYVSSEELPKSSSFSSALVSAIHSRRTTFDITHALSLATTTIDQVADTLYATLSAFEAQSHNDLSWTRTCEILGVAVEIYGAKARQTQKEDERNKFLARRDTAHDMCSMAACNTAFEDCREGDNYDLNAVWQLVGMTQWAISFMEKLMKDCVLLSPAAASEPSDESKMDVQADGDDLFGSTPTSPAYDIGSPILETPTLLHFGHPRVLADLRSVLTHVKNFRRFLGNLSPGGENAQIARDILVDLVDRSGLNIEALDSLLAECIRDTEPISADDARKSLACCQPVPAMTVALRQIIQKLMSASVIDKPRLFVKSSDLVDGFSALSIVDRPSKEKAKDVVSKGLLTQQGVTSICLRCRGESKVGGDVGVTGHASLRWRTWENVWTAHCICGGLWALENTFNPR